jgi:hypothetical protein
MFFVCSIILIFIGTNQAISLKRLQKSGLLIKDLPCEILPRGFSGLKNLYMVEVEYRLPSGEKLTFSKNIPPTYSEDTTNSLFADLLIDPEKPQVYVLYVKN